MTIMSRSGKAYIYRQRDGKATWMINGEMFAKKVRDRRDASLDPLVNIGILTREEVLYSISDYKESVRVATVAPLPANVYDNGEVGMGATITSTAFGNLNTVGIDGITDLNEGERVLIKDEVDQKKNGIYDITSLGSPTTMYILQRSLDADTDTKMTAGNQMYATGGTVNGGLGFVLTTQDPLEIGVSLMIFEESALEAGGVPQPIIIYEADTGIESTRRIVAGNSATGNYSGALSGQNNTAEGDHSLSAGGELLKASGTEAVTIGGHNNWAKGPRSVIFGGKDNTTTPVGSDCVLIGATLSNFGNFAQSSSIISSWGSNVGGDYSGVIGGWDHVVGGGQSFVGGGVAHGMTGSHSGIVGGGYHSNRGQESFIGGGLLHVIQPSGDQAGIIGGEGHDLSGRRGFMGGGLNNIVSGTDSVAFGNEAEALHDNCFVWADSGVFATTAINQFIINSSNGVGIGTNDPKAQLHSVDDTIVGVPPAALADGDLGLGELHFWVNEGTDKLIFKVKYSTGTVKSGEVSLV